MVVVVMLVAGSVWRSADMTPTFPPASMKEFAVCVLVVTAWAETRLDRITARASAEAFIGKIPSWGKEKCDLPLLELPEGFGLRRTRVCP